MSERFSRCFVVLFVCLTLVSCGVSPGALFGSSAGAKYPPASDALTIGFIDVGQGDSILVQAGGESYLIDAGYPEEGANVVDFLRSRGVSSLDGVVSTSGDADHSGGLADVLDAFTVENIYLSGYPTETLTYTNFLRASRDEVRSEGAEVRAVSAGMRLDWAGVRVDVLNPPPASDGGLFAGSNDSSVSLLLTYGTARVILAGDAEDAAEEYMAGGPLTGPVTLMKVNHHGSNTSTKSAFLSRFRPQVAVIQSGRNNPYGHPTPEVLGRLKDAGVEVFRTDLDGDVTVTIDRKEVEVATTGTR